jgi:membrane protein
MSDKQEEQQGQGLWQRIMRNIRYCITNVWDDTRSLWSVKAVKIVNLSIQSFLDRDLQIRAAALTYNTVLAVVPALAMLFAIGRGFGFQNLLQSELFRYFPAQREALETASTYVDNYLAQASQGAFIGIGLVFLM